MGMNNDVKYAYFIFVKQRYKIIRNKSNKMVGYGNDTIFVYETNPLITGYAAI